ncbi:hypothetical protein HAX54_012042 [Datura stramonium]|uniref:Xylanase inhibitor C-terminal domain-containing protein n=1 Tax=Datura stramonium TaxID=4076 RepID=A0ABS8TM08_DATST|nr:hypothetical protein [Datura stramonium]
MAGLGRTRISLPSQFSAEFSFPRKFAVCLTSSNSKGVVLFGDGVGGTKISTVNPYTVLETSLYNAITNFFVKELAPMSEVAPVAPFGACLIQETLIQVGPAVPFIDLVLQNENVVWTIFGANSLVQVN